MAKAHPRHVAQRTYFSHLLDTNGDGTGDNNAIGVYSVASPGTFFYKCKEGERVNVNRMIVYLRGAGLWTLVSYGSIMGGLTNGVLLRVCDGASIVQHDLLTSLQVKSNADWGRCCHDAQINNTMGAGDTSGNVRWTFLKDSDSGIVLTADDTIEMICQDDLSDLVEHRCFIRGEIFEQ